MFGERDQKLIERLISMLITRLIRLTRDLSSAFDIGLLKSPLEDDLVQDALRKGTDLRQYSKQIEKELQDVENASIAGENMEGWIFYAVCSRTSYWYWRLEGGWPTQDNSSLAFISNLRLHQGGWQYRPTSYANMLGRWHSGTDGKHAPWVSGGSGKYLLPGMISVDLAFPP